MSFNQKNERNICIFIYVSIYCTVYITYIFNFFFNKIFYIIYNPEHALKMMHMTKILL